MVATNGARLPIPLISPQSQATKTQWSSLVSPRCRPVGRALKTQNPMVAGGEPHRVLVLVSTSSLAQLVSACTDPLLTGGNQGS